MQEVYDITTRLLDAVDESNNKIQEIRENLEKLLVEMERMV